MDMKEYESPATGVIEVIGSNRICNPSFDNNHMTEILLTEDEETI